MSDDSLDRRGPGDEGDQVGGDPPRPTGPPPARPLFDPADLYVPGVSPAPPPDAPPPGYAGAAPPGSEMSPPPGGAPERKRKVWPFVALVVLVVGGGAAAFLLLGSSGKDYPDEWDERVLDIVNFVERERELEFAHPVEIEFLDEAEWKARHKIEQEDILDEEAALLEHGEGLFRAFGLAEGDLDLLGDTETLSTSGTVGFYEFDDERIVVRGEELTIEVEVTLAHELTHVLQDQHFDIGDRLERLREGDDTEASLRTLVEGDAGRIEDKWVDHLSEQAQRTYERQTDESSSDAEEALSELPQSLVTFFASDYILGDAFVAVLEAEGGEDAIDEAFRTPPGPDEHVLDPLSYLADDEPEAVDPPDIDGTPIEDLDGDFGAGSLFLMLAERINPVDAFRATQGWGGDSFTAFTRDDRTCAAISVRGENRDSARLLRDALTEWAKAMPDGAGATVEHDGDLVDVVSCDPGTKADLIEGEGRSQEAIAIPAIRTELVTQVLDSGGTISQARCFGDGVIANVPYDFLTSDELTAAQNQRVQEIATAQVARCR